MFQSIRKKDEGFTLLEVLLSFALIAVLTAIVTPIYLSFQTRNDADIVATSIAQSSRRAQLLAQASDGDIGWGVNIASGTITLFKGASFATRDTTFDETTDMPSNIAISGTTEYDFAKFTGLPTSTGTVTLTSTTNDVRTITINTKGMVSY